MQFAAEGGQGEINYTAKMQDVTRDVAPEAEVEATCEADWVTIGETDFTKCRFEVAVNEGEARETKIVVSYADKSFEVTVKQAAKGAEPQPEYVMDVEMSAAMRFPSEDFDMPNNAFALLFADDAENTILQILIFDEEGEVVLPAGEYDIEDSLLEIVEQEEEYEFEEGVAVVEVTEDVYSFDIVLTNENGDYHFTYEGVVIDMVPEDKPEPQPEEFTPVKVVAYRSDSWDLGNFELDLYIDEENYHALDMQDNTNPNDKCLTAGNYTMDNGGVTSWSNFLWNIETGEGAYVVDADITLTHNQDGTSTIQGFFESEYGDVLNINWTGVIEGFTFGGNDSEEVVFNATFFGGEYYDFDIHNYYFALSDVEIDGNLAVPGATYYYFDLYTDQVNDSLTIPNGVYTFDKSNSYASGTFSEEYGYGFYVNEDSTPVWYIYGEGSTVTVTDNKIVAELILEDGTKHTVVYEGNLSLGNTGDDDDDNGNTNTGDMDVSISNTTIYAEYYDQWYSPDTDNWLVQVYEDIETGNGKYFVFDLLADYATSVDYRGTFTASDGYEINTFVPGFIDEGYLAGSWYAEIEDGVATGVMVPLTGGTITVTFNDDGSQTFVLDCTDDSGNKITGSVIGVPFSSQYAYSATPRNAHRNISFAKPVLATR